MAIVTVEDLQGSIEVVVFPRLYEQTRPVWIDGRILLIAGRIDHKGEEISLLADLAVDWDDAVAQGPDAFAREVAAGDRGGRRRPAVGVAGPGTNGNGAHAPQLVSAAAHGGEAGRRTNALRWSRRSVPTPSRHRPHCRRSRRRHRFRPTSSRARVPSTTIATRGRPCPTRRASGSWSRANVERAGRRTGGRGPPRAVRAARRPRSAGRSHGGLQGVAARPAGRNSRGDPCRDRPAVSHFPWSCGRVLPTTRNCWPRSAAGSAKGSSTSSSRDRSGWDGQARCVSDTSVSGPESRVLAAPGDGAAELMPQFDLDTGPTGLPGNRVMAGARYAVDYPRSAAPPVRARRRHESRHAHGCVSVWPSAIRRTACTDDNSSWYSARTSLTVSSSSPARARSG